MKVLNLRDLRDGYDRSKVARVDRKTIFGNPFHLMRYATLEEREACIRKYRGWFMDRVTNDREFRLKVLALKGRDLACWCAPLPCHANVIAEWIEGHREKTLKQYILPAYWQVSARMVVEAASLEEAIKLAYEMPNPAGEYVEGSFEVDMEVLEEYVPKEEVRAYLESRDENPETSVSNP